MIKVGIVGCGTIGTELIKAIEKDFKGRMKLVAVCDADINKAASVIKTLKRKTRILSLENLIKASDLIVEAASASVSAMVAKKALSAGKEAMIMSIGGLINRGDVFRLANKRKKNLYLPSGAVCGLDGVKSAKTAKIAEVILVTTKSPKALEGAPYLIKKKINLGLLKKEKVIFNGTAEDAIAGFPKNINVSAVLSLAGVGAKKTKVKIICSPNAKVNSHIIKVKGDFGEFTTQTNNLPSPGNPKTSYMAVLSAIATLNSITDYVKIGN
ncbi:MAG: aspartate dehydrogenase [Candidatus Omnitrophota bacterium]